MTALLSRPGRVVAAFSPAHIGRAATLALHDELALAPKPGLVSFEDTGSHDDMDAHTFMRSLLALRSYFTHMAELGAAFASFDALERSGIEAEARMLAATGGINTHRGAIFMLGLLCAAAGAAQANGLVLSAAHWRAALQQHWGSALQARCARASVLSGGRAARQYGLRSASEEAALGLPVLFECAAPSWRAAQARGLSGQRLQLQVFFQIMAELDDCNIAHRGGLEGLAFARTEAQRFLMNGGAARTEALTEAREIHAAFVARRLSPGGCADTLSAICLLHRLGALG